MNYYVLQYYKQFEPYQYPQALFVSEEPVDFNKLFIKLNDQITKKHPLDSFSEEEEEYDEFMFDKMVEELSKHGVKKVDFHLATYSPEGEIEGLNLYGKVFTKKINKKPYYLIRFF